MAKKQTRRSISVSRTTYERLKAFCEANGTSMSQFVEGRVGDVLATVHVPVPAPVPQVVVRPEPAPVRVAAPPPRPVAPPPPAAPKREPVAPVATAETIFTF
jgi:hypothetical protein